VLSAQKYAVSPAGNADESPSSVRFCVCEVLLMIEKVLYLFPHERGFAAVYPLIFFLLNVEL